MDTTILPTPPTSGAIVQSDNGRNDCLADLILSNNIADNARAILTTQAQNTAAIIAADQNGHLINQKTTGDASVANINATNLNGVANLKATGDASVANLKATYDAQVAGTNITNLTSVATQKAITDSALANALSAAEIRELINTTSTANLVATKDEGCKSRELILIEGHKTREKETEHFAALQLQACKDTAAVLLESERNKAALAAQIAACCCKQEQEASATRALILSESNRVLERETTDLRTRLMILTGGVIGSAKAV